jgi:hypothetical protein
MKKQIPTLHVTDRDQKTIRSLVNRYEQEALANYILTFDFGPPKKKGGPKQPKTRQLILAALFHSCDWSASECAKTISETFRFGYERESGKSVDKMNAHAIEVDLARILKEASPGSALDLQIKSIIPHLQHQFNDTLNNWEKPEMKDNKPPHSSYRPSMAVSWLGVTVKLTIQDYHKFLKLVFKMNKARSTVTA